MYGLIARLLSLHSDMGMLFGIKAFAVAILGGMTSASGVMLAVLVSAAVGVLLAPPASRMAGPFLAMVTIAFAFIVEHLAIEWRRLTGGQNGLMGFDPPELFGLRFGEPQLVALAIVLASLLLLGDRRLADSGWGLAMSALRDHEIAASSLGFDPVTVKRLAFAIATGTAGLGGGLFASLIQFIAPSNFTLSQSILFLFAVILGGAGTVLGPLDGAAVVVLLPEMLAGLAEYRLLFFGALLGW
ncbi:branched-chain amino acid ABC transporter permease [uncultured Salipiger sp.]|uniref:branched-chain amino acid ABC transporter permease n=1 Tax=uncultured Salipiger sp. TaxID=499810 RepID=UPI002592E9F2|nr:branched-chain amino acid ABC transporter permease [uncultured Salipiger sp.]